MPSFVFKKIVCGVDGSPAGLEAVKQARRLAPDDAELTLVGVSEAHLAVRTGAFAPGWAERLDDDAQSAFSRDDPVGAEVVEHVTYPPTIDGARSRSRRPADLDRAKVGEDVLRSAKRSEVTP